MPKPDLARLRKAAEPAVNAGGVCCGLCGREIVARQIRLRPTTANPLGRLVSNWHWDHTSGGPSHKLCNERDGQRISMASPKRRARRRRRPFTAVAASRQW